MEIFFLEQAGELLIFVLREEIWKYSLTFTKVAGGRFT